MPLTPEQKAYCYAQLRHIERLRNLLNVAVIDLLRRGETHDQTKMQEPEMAIFIAKAENLEEMTYAGPEYTESRRKLAAALQHHYAVSRHHPEHFKNGVNDMTLLDLLEMLLDWKASSERQHNGNILTSITENKHRFHIDTQLAQILENTAKVFDNV